MGRMLTSWIVAHQNVARLGVKGDDGVAEEAIGNQRSRRRSFLLAVRTLVLLRLQQRRSNAIVAERAAATWNHHRVLEDAFADGADQIVGNLALLLDELVLLRLLILRSDVVPQRPRDARHLLALGPRLVMVMLLSTRRIHRAVLYPVPRLVTLVAPVIARHFAHLVQPPHSLVTVGRKKDLRKKLRKKICTGWVK